MLNLNKRSDRKLVYLNTKESYEKLINTPEYLRNRHIKTYGFCSELDRSVDIINGSNYGITNIYKFPEIVMFKPYANPDSAYWFSLNNEGCWKRVSILSHAIRMCDHPWTIPFYKFLIRFKLIRLGL